MATVFIPTQMRDLTVGASEVTVEGNTLRQVVEALEAEFPGLKARLIERDELVPGLAVSIDGEVASLGLLAPVRPDSEIHILPAVGGG